MRHIGRFTITKRQREENPEKVALIFNMNIISSVIDPLTGDQVVLAEDDKWFDAVDKTDEIPEYELVINERQAVSCHRLRDTPTEQKPAELDSTGRDTVDNKTIEFPKKKIKRMKTV